MILPAAPPGIVGADPHGRQPRHRRDDDRRPWVPVPPPSLDLNQFEAMTTMTVKIVGQLTGDTDFAIRRKRWSPLRWG